MKIRQCLYVAYGLNIESEVHLPELSAGRSTRPDVIVRRDRIDTFEPNIIHRNHRACFDDIQFSYDGVGKFRVRRGREIVVAAEPGADSIFLRVCLLGPALAALLHQRGLLVLHGSALKMNGEGVAFLGGKGWGKSTLAAYMHSRGHMFLADDLVALGARSAEPVQLVPGFPHLKLWPNSAIYLQLDLNKMTRLHPEVEKRGHRLDGDLPPALSTAQYAGHWGEGRDRAHRAKTGVCGTSATYISRRLSGANWDGPCAPGSVWEGCELCAHLFVEEAAHSIEAS